MEKFGERKKEESEKMKLTILGGSEDIQEMVAPMITYMGEKLKITVSPCPIENNKPRQFYVEIETKKN